MVVALPESDARVFDAALEWLTSLSGRGIVLGLERVEAALARLGNPHEGMVAVTVAGTNGKGSTCAFLASIMHAAGYRVGLYTSPHLVSVTERIRIGGHTILPSDFARWVGLVRAAITHEPAIPLTQFEVLTVMALGYFHERQVDVAVLEVGLGGRLDATNVVPAKVAVLTPIGLDHQDILGKTKRAIAAEKVAILKPGGTLVCGIAPSLWRDVVGPYSFALRAAARRAGVDFVGSFEEDGFRYRGAIHRLGAVTLGIRGVHQGMNASLACAAAEALAGIGFHLKAHHLAEGLYRARHRARLERIEVFGRRPLAGAADRRRTQPDGGPRARAPHRGVSTGAPARDALRRQPRQGRAHHVGRARAQGRRGGADAVERQAGAGLRALCQPPAAARETPGPWAALRASCRRVARRRARAARLARGARDRDHHRRPRGRAARHGQPLPHRGPVAAAAGQRALTFTCA